MCIYISGSRCVHTHTHWTTTVTLALRTCTSRGNNMLNNKYRFIRTCWCMYHNNNNNNSDNNKIIIIIFSNNNNNNNNNDNDNILSRRKIHISLLMRICMFCIKIVHILIYSTMILCLLQFFLLWIKLAKPAPDKCVLKTGGLNTTYVCTYVTCWKCKELQKGF